MTKLKNSNCDKTQKLKLKKTNKKNEPVQKRKKTKNILNYRKLQEEYEITNIQEDEVFFFFFDRDRL